MFNFEKKLFRNIANQNFICHKKVFISFQQNLFEICFSKNKKFFDFWANWGFKKPGENHFRSKNKILVKERKKERKIESARNFWKNIIFKKILRKLIFVLPLSISEYSIKLKSDEC